MSQPESQNTPSPQDTPGTEEDLAPDRVSLQDRVRIIYGQSRPFRVGLIIFELLVVLFFIVTTFIPFQPWLIWVDAILGLILLTDFLGRCWIDRNLKEHLLQPSVMLDLVVIITMFVPIVAGEFAFLRILRALRLIKTYSLVRDLRKNGNFFSRHGEVINSMLNMLVFIFIASATVYALQHGSNPTIQNYVDALYFTVATLTTTGFGDITLTGDHGHLLAVIIMLVGITLFLRLAQTMFRPHKVHVECEHCGLSRHDPDAVHCKHCGAIVHIDSEGQ